MTKLCSKCGLTNPSDAAFCHNCASPLSGFQQAVSKQAAWTEPPAGAAPVMGGQAYIAAPPGSQKPLIAMILAIAAFLCCGPILGIPAAILGWMELEAIKSGRSPESGKVMATVGLWGGILATIGHILLYVIWFFLGLISSSPYAY